MVEIQTSIQNLTYKELVPVRGILLSENNFLKVTLLGEDYFISVLPKFHNATLEEIAFKIKYFFNHYTLNFDSIDLTKIFFNLVSLDDYLSNINQETLFNLETLLLGMLTKTHPGLFKHNEILVNELYRPKLGPNHYINSKCLKLKITPKSVDKTIRLLNELHRHNNELLIRLDGNRLFELNELITFEKTLKDNVSESTFQKIDYIEEPFKNYADTYLFSKRSELTLAMDESFSSLMNESTDQFTKNTPVVIKPSLFGISPIYNWMLKHPKNRKIISSSFEHPSVKIGLDFLARQCPEEYHGLENFL